MSLNSFGGGKKPLPPPRLAQSVFHPRRSIVAVDVYRDKIIVHLSDGSQIPHLHTQSGQSIRYSSFYGGLKIEPFPFRPERHHG